MVDVLDGLLSPFPVSLDILVLRQCQAVERCHSHPEKLVEIIRVDAKERFFFFHFYIINRFIIILAQNYLIYTTNVLHSH